MQNNKVRLNQFLPFCHMSSSFHVGTRTTLHLPESNWRSWCTISWSGIAEQHSETKTISSFLLYLSFPFCLDTHRTLSRSQSNRKSRCTISQPGIAKQHSKIKTVSSFRSYSSFVFQIDTHATQPLS
jgi:hypothetical protein